MRVSNLWWLLAGLGLLLGGCPKNVPPPTDEVTDAAELLEAINGATTSIDDARMLDVRLDYFGQQGRASIKQLILLQHPDRLRIQTYIPGMEGVAGVLVCACGKFAFHDRQEDVYYHGPATTENIARVMPVGLNCKDLAHVLLGGAPHDRLGSMGVEPSIQWDRTEGGYLLDWQGASGEDSRARVWVRHGDWRVTKMTTWTADGETRYDYEAEKFAKMGEIILPGRRRFVVKSTGEDFSLTQGETQVNPELDEVLFQLAPPAGSPVRYIGPQSSPPPPPVDGDLCGG